jgi:hypothetical protein
MYTKVVLVCSKWWFQNMLKDWRRRYAGAPRPHVYNSGYDVNKKNEHKVSTSIDFILDFGGI